MLQNTIETLNYVLFLLPGETSTKRTVCVGVLWLGQLRLCDGNTTHRLQSALQRLLGKERNAFILLPRIKKAFCTIYEEGTADIRSYSGGRLFKSLGRHRIVQKPMQEKQRTIDLSSCKSYICKKKKKKKSSYWTNDTACSQEQFGWLYSFAIT